MVKTLNTTNNQVMVDPTQLIDLGALHTARSIEPVVLLWVSLFQAMGTEDVTIGVFSA